MTSPIHIKRTAFYKLNISSDIQAWPPIFQKTTFSKLNISNDIQPPSVHDMWA